MRGIPVVQVPTSLLAMVDASIGGKTAVDTPHGKNLVGAFHAPALVVVDPGVLETLPGRERRAGAAEMLKHGVIGDAEHFDQLARDLPRLLDQPSEDAWTPLIRRSIEIKSGVVSADFRESGLRKTLNFGHTLGHAIESASGFALLHGECVAIGMALESRLAERVDVARGGTAARVAEAIRAVGLPVERPTSTSPERVLEEMRVDKKARLGRVEFALPRRVGDMAPGEGGWSIAVPDEVVLEVLR
jgi:3-dehydroquinate synthase